MLSEAPALRKPSQHARMPSAPSDNFPLVSVVLPTYNGEDTLERCLESIMAQDYPNFEVLISDDCSADSSANIAAGFARRYPNVSFSANKERLGVWRNPCSGAMRSQKPESPSRMSSAAVTFILLHKTT